MLLVDDDEDWRAVMAEVLTEAGFFVSTASDGRAALVSWRRMTTEVVVTDVQMPVMDGCALFAALHSSDRTLPIIVLTGEGVVDAASTFAGAFMIIRKPAAPEAVLSAVTEALLRHRLSADRQRRRAGLALAGLGAAAAVAVLIGAIRALVA